MFISSYVSSRLIFVILFALVVSSQFSSTVTVTVTPSQLQILDTDEDICLKDRVCDLTKETKIGLCDKIFSNFRGRSEGTLEIYINKAAFYIPKLTCTDKPLLLNAEKTQPMYPCYGRHATVHTSFAEDHYADRFYVSGGHICDSVFVYERVNVDGLYIYLMVEYLKELEIENLLPITVTEADVTEELALTEIAVTTTDGYEIESIYSREIINGENIIPDIVCDLPKEKKAALCELILDRDTYKNGLRLYFNHAAFFGFTPTCEEKVVRFRVLSRHDEKTIKEKMLPCFGRHEPTPEQVLQDSYLKYVRVSTGPKLNSVFVYNPGDTSTDEYVIVELVENLRFDELSDVVTTERDVVEESITNIEKMNPHVHVQRRSKKAQPDDVEDEELMDFYERLYDVWRIEDEIKEDSKEDTEIEESESEVEETEEGETEETDVEESEEGETQIKEREVERKRK